MNQKTAKKLRSTAVDALKFGPNMGSARAVGFTSGSKPILEEANKLGLTEKEARRQTRVAAKSSGKKVPGWAERRAEPKPKSAHGIHKAQIRFMKEQKRLQKVSEAQ